MARNEWRKKRTPRVLQDHFLWEMVCCTTVPFRDKLHSSILEDAADIENKKQRVTQIFSFSQGNQQQSTITKSQKEIAIQPKKIYLFDRVAHRKIAKGHYSIEARLDLHGCIQTEAYFFLKNFLQSSQQRGLRYVLVITGKGRSHGSNGVLHQLVPRWLSTPVFCHYIHSFGQAFRQHGGSGALYIRLRRLVSEKKV